MNVTNRPGHPTMFSVWKIVLLTGVLESPKGQKSQFFTFGHGFVIHVRWLWQPREHLWMRMALRIRNISINSASDKPVLTSIQNTGLTSSRRGGPMDIYRVVIMGVRCSPGSFWLNKRFSYYFYGLINSECTNNHSAFYPFALPT